MVVIGDFDRPHLHLSAHHVSTILDKERELVRAAREFAGPGIVYAATHASAQAAHDALASAGERVTPCWRGSSITGRPLTPGRGWLSYRRWICTVPARSVVLPGDLALRKAVQAAYQLDHLPSQQEVLSIAEKWRPHRSLATS